MSIKTLNSDIETLKKQNYNLQQQLESRQKDLSNFEKSEIEDPS